MLPHIAIVINFSHNASNFLLFGIAMSLNAWTLSGVGIIPCLKQDIVNYL